MGILDDAIREHLELKRRRGADPTEIERLEQEALGPVRRLQESGEPLVEGAQPARAYQDEPLPTVVAEPEPPAEAWELEQEEALLPGESWEHEPAAGAEPSGDRALDAEVSVDHAPVEPAPDYPAAQPEHEYPTGEVPAAAPPAAAPQPPADVPPAAAATPSPALAPPGPEPEPGGETVEYDVEAEHAREGSGQGDDVLEETPEFLQDTPDHDRLWFEQRPPRDFDFDG